MNHITPLDETYLWVRALVRQAIESRLFALSRSHDLLTLQNWESASLFDLVHRAVLPFSAAGELAERIVLSGPDISLPPKPALALGIAFNELATNAAKYGALSDAAGRLVVGWEIIDAEEGRQLKITWQESSGPEVEEPARKGFGSNVIQRGLTLELDAVVHLDYLPAGVRCIINVPLDQGRDE